MASGGYALIILLKNLPIYFSGLQHRLFWCLCAALFLASCSGGKKEGEGARTVIARVGGAELTLEEARTAIDTSYGGADEQLRRYISSWVNVQLLYLEAKRRNIEGDEAFRREVEEAGRQLAIQNLLQKHVYADTAGLSDDSLRAYFDAHAGEFPVREDIIRLNAAAFSTRERANAFAALVAKGSTWVDAAEKIRAETKTPSPDIFAVDTGRQETRQTLVPSELWKVAATLSDGEVSFPVKTEGGYYILQLLASARRGSPASFALARDEVRQRLRIEQRRRLYAELLGTLRKRYSVEILLNLENTTDLTRTNE